MGAIALLLSLSGCGASVGRVRDAPTATTVASSAPRFVNHPRPELLVDVEPFEEAGCSLREGIRARCGSEPWLGVLNCDWMSKPPDLLGGLAPSYPMALCLREEDQGGYLYKIGASLPAYVGYVVLRDGEPTSARTEEALQALFAPVESAEEALSYALAVTGLEAYYGLQLEPKLRYYAQTIEDTHVERTQEGYLVHLYHYQRFGCGVHDTYAVDLQVSPEGRVQEVGRVAAFKNPAQDGVCVD
jgi:hypothetical protein